MLRRQEEEDISILIYLNSHQVEAELHLLGLQKAKMAEIITLKKVDHKEDLSKNWRHLKNDLTWETLTPSPAHIQEEPKHFFFFFFLQRVLKKKKYCGRWKVRPGELQNFLQI